MPRLSFLGANAVVGLVLGVPTAVLPAPGFLVLAATLTALVYSLRTFPLRRAWRLCLAAVVIQLATIAATLTAAAYAPMKTADHLLNEKRIVLPKTAMTLGELKEQEETGQLRVPLLRGIHMSEREAILLVHWPATELTMRDFVRAIEEQTPLRHKFGNCKFGTILTGGDCAFGLTLYSPDGKQR